MTTPRRIQMDPQAAPEDIITSDGAFLGRFIAGHGYWVTPQNLPTVEKVLKDGRATEVSPSDTEDLIKSQKAIVSGLVTMR